MAPTPKRVAIVTAAGRGLGAAVAKRLARDGYALALLAPGEGVEALARELGAIAIRGSVTEPDDLARLVDATVKAHARIDAVVTSTGHPPKGELLALTDAQWRLGFDLVFLNVVRLARLVTPVMMAQKSGVFVNLSSYAALEPEHDFPLSTLRGALAAWTKLYADEHAAYGIRMNAVLPGFADSLPEKAERTARIPMRRYGTVAEIANAVAFLVSDQASYITGQSLRVDGGLTRHV
jgi:NAD(P)-dependent dehydrogenase (short-subunit alcohol dehydrogenase family)